MAFLVQYAIYILCNMQYIYCTRNAVAVAGERARRQGAAKPSRACTQYRIVFKKAVASSRHAREERNTNISASTVLRVRAYSYVMTVFRTARHRENSAFVLIARARFSIPIFVSNTRTAGWSVFGARAFGSEGSALADTRASRVSW